MDDRHTLGFILNPVDARVVFYNPFPPVTVASTLDVQAEEYALNTEYTTSQATHDQQRVEHEDAEATTDEETDSNFKTRVEVWRGHVDDALGDDASGHREVGYATPSLADQQDTRSVNTETTPYDDDDEDEEMFFDAQDTSSLDESYDVHAPPPTPNSHSQRLDDSPYHAETAESWVLIDDSSARGSSQGHPDVSPLAGAYEAQTLNSPSPTNNESRRHDVVSNYTVDTSEGWVSENSEEGQEGFQGYLDVLLLDGAYETQVPPPTANSNCQGHDNVTYYIGDTPEGWASEDSENDQEGYEGNLTSHTTGWVLSSANSSDEDVTDTDTDSVNDESNIAHYESNTGILPVLSAFARETNNTTEAVSSGCLTTGDCLNHGSDEPLGEDLGSDVELSDQENDDSTDFESEEEGSQSFDDSEEEDSDTDNEDENEEDSDGKGENDEGSTTSTAGPSKDVDGEDAELVVEVDSATGLPIARYPSLYQQIPHIHDVQLGVPERLSGVQRYLGDMQVDVWRRARRCRDDVSNNSQRTRGTKRESDDEDEEDERAHKMQRRL